MISHAGEVVELIDTAIQGVSWVGRELLWCVLG
jgi:hypothetical protein